MVQPANGHAGVSIAEQLAPLAADLRSLEGEVL